MIIQVQSERTYPIIIDSSWKTELVKLLDGTNKVAIIVSEKMQSSVKDLIAGEAEVLVFPIPDGEAGKTSATLNRIWDWLGAAGFTRSDLIIGIGGGAVTDLAGYAAASWLRGIDWVAIPTTVAGAVDAAIGGKTAINSEYGKNLIGAFHSPSAVIVDVSWFETLSDRDFAAGMAEVVKAGFISDAKILDLIGMAKIAELRSNREVVIELVTRAIAVKAKVVSSDFKESFDREILNYGHTFGHAVEKHAKYSLRHGECVSIGMAFMAHLQFELGLITDDVRDLHLSLLTGINLPVTYSAGDWPELRALMSMDKKSRGNSLRFVTISEIGKTDRIADVAQGHLLSAYEKVCS